MTTDETPTLKITQDVLAAARAQAGEASETISPDTATAETLAPTEANVSAPVETASAALDAAGAPTDVITPPADTEHATNGHSSETTGQVSATPQPAQASEAPQTGDPTDIASLEKPDASDEQAASDPTVAPLATDETATAPVTLAGASATTDTLAEVAGGAESLATTGEPAAEPALTDETSGQAANMAPTNEAADMEANTETTSHAGAVAVLTEAKADTQDESAPTPEASVATDEFAQGGVSKENADDTEGAEASASDANPAEPEPTIAEAATSPEQAQTGVEAMVESTEPVAALASVPEASPELTSPELATRETSDAESAADATVVMDGAVAPELVETTETTEASAASATDRASESTETGNGTDPTGEVSAAEAIKETETSEERDPDFMRFFATRIHFGNLAFSPDGSQIAYITNASGQLNVWRQPVTGGWASQVTTFEEESARGVLWGANGELIGSADRSGSEQYDLFTIPAHGGVTTYLTNTPTAQYQLSDESLSPDGRYLAYGGNDRQPTDGDVLVRDMQTGEVRRLLANGRYNIPVNWSPDGRYLTVVDLRGNTDLHLWLLEAATGEIREVLPHAEPFFLAPGPWLPDSSGFYVITDRGREFKGIARYRLASSDLEWLVAAEWDVEHLALSADGQRLIWALNESGRSQLYLRDNDQVALRMSGLPVGVIEQLTLTPDGQTLALRINASTSPAELYIVTLGPIGAMATPHLRRLTFGMLGGLMTSDLIEPESVTYPTFDGRQIPAWLYRPRIADGTRAPLVVSVHGGPEAQERVEYRAFYQYLLSKGIGVLAPNIRGSTGYGLAYQKMIHRDWGGAELKDIQAAAEYARTLSWVDSARLGVYGGSFGGFATLSAVTRLPDYWAAAVDIVGPSNLLTFARNVPPTWRRMMTQWVGDPDDAADAEMMRQRSPITYVEQTRAPLLVLQGANDPRVVKSESDQMVERLRELDRTVEYVVFADEGHGFTKRSNTLRGYWLAGEFFTRWLG